MKEGAIFYMAYKYLVIVESPAKAKTIEKYLGATIKLLRVLDIFVICRKAKWALMSKMTMNLITSRFAAKAMSSRAFVLQLKSRKSLSRK